MGEIMKSTNVIENFLKEIIMKYTAIPLEEFDLEMNFQEYGINSFMMLEMTEEIENELGIQVSKTIFFEYLNLRELLDYFEEHHSDLFIENQKMMDDEAEKYVIADELL
ncbi:acyl carrier protein [Clostridium aminobutyricum]|uniref:Acyl carrier protein n=1 Tax=Clostridium aminobutyricum TaxID=33953 RepID=A0A939D9L8_CLOAM|nr:acyl carrier protein [Clostridium aminobutyricum]MBN7773944.1 acyl carrier protein [Clostridium aminobutyricum]